MGPPLAATPKTCFPEHWMSIGLAGSQKICLLVRQGLWLLVYAPLSEELRYHPPNY